MARLILGDLLTLDTKIPRARAMVVADGRIVAVGDPVEVSSPLRGDIDVLDFGDQTVLPGFIDCHHHMLWTGMADVHLDLSPARSIAELLDMVRRWVRDHPDGDWIISSEGWEIADLIEQRYPTRAELDAICPERPVYLARGGHEAAVNSAALLRAGLSPEGQWASGHLIEHARDLVRGQLPELSTQERKDALFAGQRRCLEQGITRVVEPGLSLAEVDAYRMANVSGQLRMRATLLGVVPSGAAAVKSAETFLPLAREMKDDPRLHFGGFKVFLDGGGSLGTAWLRDPYPGRPDYYGERLIEQPDLDALYEFAFGQGLPVGAHTVGNAAVDSALRSIARLRPASQVQHLGFSLIHAYLWPSPESMRTAAQLGVRVAAQPGMYARFAETLANRFGWEATELASPLRSWLSAGVTVGGGSDSPVTASSPVHGIWQAVTRQHGGRCLNPAETLDRNAALRLYGPGAAAVAMVDATEGVLRPGARADWVVLNGDPLSCRASELADLRVVATAIGGDIVHQTAQ